MNVLAVCAGVGGLELGIKIARPDARGVCYVEREAHAAACLVARMEDQTLDEAPIWSDLGTFDFEPWRGVVDCIASGDPCQPNSLAGKRLGEDDERWLLDRVLNGVEACRPGYFFRENVPGNADGQLSVLVPRLERLGYRVAAGIFSAEEVGAPHGRKRVFLMGDRGFEWEHYMAHTNSLREFESSLCLLMPGVSFQSRLHGVGHFFTAVDNPVPDFSLIP